MLWLNGGPATVDLWDLKPGHENGGPFKEIATSVPGTNISEHLPKLSAIGSEFSIIRSMSTREGDHSRARFVSATGYVPQGAIQFPSVGSLVAHEFDGMDRDIPSYVHIGGRPRITNGGFLGPKYAPFVVSGGGGRRGPAETAPADLRVADLKPAGEISEDRQRMRSELAAELRGLSVLPAGSPVVEALDSANDRARRLMRPEAAAAFDLSKEDEALREAYGKGSFGQGCLMARRLVECGVRFVEVSLDGWDTHANNFDRVKELSQQLDWGFGTLLTDLKQRGMLDSTLVVCQGEFGRTPRINGQAGRDHWPASWAAVLAGAGVRGGRVVGATSKDGIAVESTPTRTSDLMATVFKSVGLDPMKQNMSNVSRPIRLANPEGKPIEELL
ncbi:MAG TPA: DUF1501 domain-containing protein [Pirellulales bacterium]|nr:DUF1501 domain-containing protein [Pirellulales bacterium]